MRTFFITAIVCLVGLFAQETTALSCSQNSDCMSVTTASVWSSCTNGVCTCTNGAYGDATAANKCGCDSGNIVGQGGVYCLNVASEIAAKEKCERQKAMFRLIYQDVPFPKNIPIILGTKSTFDRFTPDVVGRVIAAGSYPDITFSDEYFYGLAASPYGYASRIWIRDLRCEGDTTWGRIDALMNFTLSPIAHHRMNNISHYIRMKHAADDRVMMFDAVFTNMGAASNISPTESFEAAPGFFVLKRPVILNAICGLIMNSCTGVNQQYASMDACLAYHSALEWGTWDRMYANSTVCHQVHALLVGFRPDVHCPHTGPGGGGVCVETPYENFYQVDPVEPHYGYELLTTSPLADPVAKRFAYEGQDILTLEDVAIQHVATLVANQPAKRSLRSQR